MISPVAERLNKGLTRALFPWCAGEFRAQLDADRESRLARGSNHADLRKKKRKRDKDKKDKKDKKKSACLAPSKLRPFL